MEKYISLFLLIFMFLFMGCTDNSFQVDTKISPKVTVVGNLLAVQYDLGDLRVLDEWKDINASEFLFLAQEGNIKEINLKFYCDDSGVNTPYFNYTINHIEIRTNPVRTRILFRYVDSFPDVKWIIKDEKQVSSDDSEEKKTESSPSNAKSDTKSNTKKSVRNNTLKKL